MSFPKSAQRKGGLAPATASQKEAAKDWIQQNQPWKKSTGPVTGNGKAVSALNSMRGYFSRRVKEWEVEDFAGELAKIDAMIEDIKEYLATQNLCSHRLAISKHQGRGERGIWVKYNVRITLQIYAEGVLYGQCPESMRLASERIAMIRSEHNFL